MTAFACVTVTVSAAAQPVTHIGGDYSIARWTTAEGLPQNTVNDIALLPNGELWLATFGGLARFNGHRFHLLDVATDEGLAANRVVSLAAAGDDGFWFLTQQGHLGRVERGRATSHVPPASRTVDAISLFASSTGSLYCKLVDGSVWHTDGTRPWTRVLASTNTGGVLHAFAPSGDRNVWASWGRQLVMLRDGKAVASHAPPAPDPDLFAATEGWLWLGTKSGLARLVEGRIEPVRSEPDIGGPVSVVEPVGTGELWVAVSGTVSRLHRQRGGPWQRVAVALGLPGGAEIRSMAADGQGRLWVGTNGAGLLRVGPRPIRVFGASSGLGEITALAPDGEGGAFATSGCRGLFHLDASGVSTPITLRDSAVDGDRADTGCGISLAPGGLGNVWARSGARLYRVERHPLRVRRLRVELPEEEGPLAPAPGGSLWVISRRGIARLLTPTGTLVREVNLAPPLVSASVAPDGALWIGGDGQVFRVDGDAVQQYGPAVHAPRGLVRDIAIGADGSTWIGTYGGGLGRLRDGRVARVSAAHGLPDNAVSRILDDGLGRVWVSTNRGLAVLGRSELEAVADGRAQTLAPVVIGPERGLAEANFGSPAGFADAGGRLWFGTIEGIVTLDAAAFPFNQALPVVRIESVGADGRQLPLAETVHVPALTERVHVEFSSFGLLHPERAWFRFRVEGAGHRWLETGSQPALDWTPPGPGLHRLLVEARNEDGVWSATPAHVVLDVLPAWWQTTLVRASVFIGAILTLLAAFQLRVRAIERRHAERLRVLEAQRQAQEREAGLRAQLEHVSRVALAGELAASLAHEVRQPIGAIVNNAEAGRRNLSQYLQRPAELEAIFGDIVADGMRASEVVRGVRGFLRPHPQETGPVDCSALVREMLPLVRAELEDNQVEVALSLAEGLQPVDGSRVQLGQVLVNLVMNACEALAGTAGDRRIEISTREHDGRVELAVRDSGPGLAAAVAERVFDPFVTTKRDGLGMGLAISRSIAEAHGGHLAADAPEGGGLRMTLSLPSSSGGSRS